MSTDKFKELDYYGLAYFWNKIKNKFALKSEANITGSNGITVTKPTEDSGDGVVVSYDNNDSVVNHISDNDIHVTSSDKANWTNKQGALSTAQLNACDSGITSNKVSGYDTHVTNSDVHVTTADKNKWNDKYTKNEVDNKISGLVNSAPETLDTLNELAQALGNDPNFATTIANQIGTKANKDNVYTKSETDTLLSGKSDTTHNHDTAYLGKTAKAESAKSADSVTWANVSGKPSSYTPSSHTHDDRYYTESEVDTKLSTKATPQDILNAIALLVDNAPETLNTLGKIATELGKKTNTSDLSTVATSGSYNDLSNKPTIPTKVSELANDSGFVNDVSNKADKSTTLSGYGITDAYTKAQVDTKVSDLVNSAPETLDTLNELASALGNDPNFATTVANQIGAKANDNSVVHTSGNETIGGIKSFSNDIRISKASPFCNVFSSGYIKGQAPTSNIYSGVRFFDDINSVSENAITGGFEIEYNRDGYNKSYIASRNYAGENHKFFTVGLRVPNDDIRSVDFIPSVNGMINLGSSANKWSKVYSDDVVHTSGDETVGGNKKFSGVLIGVDNFNIQSGGDWDGGARLTLNKKTESMSAILQTFSNTDSSAYIYDVNNFYPYANNKNNLGTSTKKWKTINGINPGALSLPKTIIGHSVDTTNWVFNGTTENTFYTNCDGFLYWIGNCEVYVIGTYIGCSTSASGTLSPLLHRGGIPVSKNMHIGVKCTYIEKMNIYITNGNV